MPPAAGVVSQRIRIPVKPMVIPQLQPPLTTTAVSEAFAKDAIIAWFRGEFAAANAIIDALCSHLMQLECGEGEAAYESAFAAIHGRRLNWIPILQMQKYYSIAEVTLQLEKVVEKKRERAIVDAREKEEFASGGCTSAFHDKDEEEEKNPESSVESTDNVRREMVEEDGGETVDDSPQPEITDSESQEVQPFPEHVDIFSNHEECEARRAQITKTKGFIAKEPVKGHMVNVVKGLKLYEDIFTDVELSKLNEFVNELRMAGRDGKLSGYIEPIPALLQDVIDHLVLWHLVPEHKKPNSCIVNFFDEGEYSQPFLKPPHLEQPLSTLCLTESTMAFGRTLFSDSEGNYRGPLTLTVKEGSLLVMTGNSSDTARHAMCSSLNKRRVSISFFRVRSRQTKAESYHEAMTLWQSGVPTPCTTQNNYEPLDIIPKYGYLQYPVVMLAPVSPVAMSPTGTSHGGTGVFLPWTVGSQRSGKHFPPRAQRQRLLPPSSQLDKQS